MTNSDFENLLKSCAQIADAFPNSIVFIGGIAIYLHSINYKATASFAEFTHDSDFYISIADMSDLRDIEELTPNRRLNKHQLIKNGFEFDIYTERYSSLIVPYDQIKTYSENFDSMSVACLEHLLVLKLEAYQDRQKSSKGSKDAKDIIRITQIAAARKRKLSKKLIEGYLSETHITLIEQMKKSPEFLALARGNAHLAKTLRSVFAKETIHLT